MHKKIYLFVLVTTYLISTFVSATVPEEVSEHIRRDSQYVKELMNLGYSKAQRELVIDRYMDSLTSKYKLSLPSGFNRAEVRELIKSVLAEVPESKQAENANNMSSTDMKDLRAFLERKTTPYLQKINLNYQGIEMPFFVNHDRNNIKHIYMNGINTDSTRSKGMFSGQGATPGTLDCLSLVVDLRGGFAIDLLNSTFTACPIPAEKQGTFLLGLAEEIARQLGMKTVKLDDYSSLICVKNNQKANLSRLRVFQTGKTWYGSFGYRDDEYDDDKAKKLQTLPLSAVEADLNNLAANMDQIKEKYLAKASEFKKRMIEQELAEFLPLKKVFDDAVKEFADIKKIDKANNEITLGQFFSWLWQKDCSSYTALESLLFDNIDINKEFASRQLSLPRTLRRDISLPWEKVEISKPVTCPMCGY